MFKSDLPVVHTVFLAEYSVTDQQVPIDRRYDEQEHLIITADHWECSTNTNKQSLSSIINIIIIIIIIIKYH